MNVDLDDDIILFITTPVIEDFLDFVFPQFRRIQLVCVFRMGLDYGHADTVVVYCCGSEGEGRLYGLGYSKDFVERVVIVIQLDGGLRLVGAITCDSHGVGRKGIRS